ncbi:MAG: hypothetical protein MK171_09220 [Pirellulales bacterium]|nr:hypothetical protein [Pirellulales bacterium]
MRKRTVIVLAGVLFACGFNRPALAVKQFQNEFYRMYGIDRDQEVKSEFAETILKAKCYVCHQGKKKKNRNPYGEELGKLLDRKKDAKKPEKIAAALEKVAELHTSPEDKESPTYGDLIKAGKLPGGSLEDAKKEPKKTALDESPAQT